MTTPKSAEPGLTDEENEELWRASKWDRTVFGRAAFARGLAAGREVQRREDAAILRNRAHPDMEPTDPWYIAVEYWAAAIEGGRDERS